ncbi:hypothetical protein [Streptomyces minutiscleroticus]|uniref:hypothetical protein n=1 Tax=Streptomyces minutiscleroticus TaxID=68238 RepID=UPI00332A888F
MRSLPLPLALTARLLPVAVLASAGWALASGPLAPASEPAAQDRPPRKSQATSGPSESAAPVAYRSAPAPCGGVAGKTVASLVPGAKAAGKEIPSTDESLRRTCSWNALKGYDYRWLDVSYEIKDAESTADTAFGERTESGEAGEAESGLGDEAYSTVGLTTEDEQETREAVVTVRVSNALVVVTYNGSDFETKKAPAAAGMREGALKAAKEAVAALDEADED